MTKLTAKVLQNAQKCLDGGDSIGHVLVFLDNRQEIFFNSCVVHIYLILTFYFFAEKCKQIIVTAAEFRVEDDVPSR